MACARAALPSSGCGLFLRLTVCYQPYIVMLAMIAGERSVIDMSVAGSMAQVNVRVDRSVKERAEEALRLSGASLPELIKKVVAKVAQGGGQCEEVLAAVDDRQQTVAPDTPFAASWAAADRLYADLGIATSPVSDDRGWDTIYSEAMDERYRQKGMIL